MSVYKIFNKKMGNYCSGETQCDQKIAIKHRVSRKKSAICKNHQAEDTRNSQNQFPQQSNDQATIIAYSIESLCTGEPISRGGQSQIFEIDAPLIQECLPQDPKQKTPIVIKKILKTQSLDCTLPSSPSRQLFLGNQSPFLIKGLNWLNGDKFIFQLMEKQEGGDLTTFLESTRGKGDDFRKLGEEGIRIILAGIILGLEYIHQNNIIYCDLKLENVLVGKDGYPLIIDFDLAQKGPKIEAKEVRGTVVYAAPEILTSHYVDKAVDLWALGVLAYMLVYGEPPFEEEQVDSDFPKLCKKKQNNFFLRRKKASPQMINLINSLMRVDPTSRIGYKQMSDLKAHPFFKSIDWKKFQQKEENSPLQTIVEKYSAKREYSSFREISQKNEYQFMTPRKNSAGRVPKCNIFTKSSL